MIRIIYPICGFVLQPRLRWVSKENHVSQRAGRAVEIGKTGGLRWHRGDAEAASEDGTVCLKRL
ncbi:hypothetical protein RMSM_07807 [Rhodopirellula maiorica SM1]|uniref:Uncharacterized protein n=1 Tax=Rhodopirellula maiorica SM1 TaxID=1265738 RepID=M5RMS9_9BACT|nr:hypothetical protein RMSM_07807 [Rhodopirellula maiorica SM1]